MITAFYITTIMLAVLLAFVTCYEAFCGFGLKDKALRLRRHSFILFFSLLLLASLSRLFTVSGGRVEIIPTLTISLDFCAFVAFAMLGSAYFGRNYYKNPYNWLFMLQLPVILILLNIVMRFTGHYHPLYSFCELVEPKTADEGLIYNFRILFLTLIGVTYIFLLIMLFMSYRWYKHHHREILSDIEQRQNLHEHGNILLYTLILIVASASNYVDSVALHIGCNVAMMLMVLWSVRVYTRFVNFTRLKLQGSFTSTLIESELKKIIYQEDNNPLFASNPNIDDVAKAMNVDKEDLSNYIYNTLNTSFSAWVSDKKLLLCAHLLKHTDRMVSDIALSIGYKNVPAMNKAFKQAFGKTPSQFRKENK